MKKETARKISLMSAMALMTAIISGCNSSGSDEQTTATTTTATMKEEQYQ